MKIKKLPKHIGIVMDGNRRYAKKTLSNPLEGYNSGAEKVEKLLEWALDYKIKELTLYALSMQNLNSRTKKELDYLFKLFKKWCKKAMKDKRLDRSKIKVNFIGRLHLLDKEIQKLMKQLMEKTKNHKKVILNLAVAYGGKEEIIDAVKKISDKAKENKLKINDINEDSFRDFLYLKSSPDLIIRTGGVKRTSNFLNYQADYSEWIFLDTMWPEFERGNFVNCLNEFSKRKRRFGK